MKCNVKEKTVPFEFDGKTFRLKFNLNVIAEIQEKYEDLDSFFEKMAKVGDMLWLLCLLINQDVKKEIAHGIAHEKSPVYDGGFFHSALVIAFAA